MLYELKWPGGGPGGGEDAVIAPSDAGAGGADSAGGGRCGVALGSSPLSLVGAAGSGSAGSSTICSMPLWRRP